MSFYKEWVNFVRYPHDPNKVWTKKDRLDCANAVMPNSEEAMESNLQKINEKGFVTTLEEILFDDDEFDIMEITNTGEVFIWTKKRVWRLQRQENKERMIFLPRHPKFSHYET